MIMYDKAELDALLEKIRELFERNKTLEEANRQLTELVAKHEMGEA